MDNENAETIVGMLKKMVMEVASQAYIAGATGKPLTELLDKINNDLDKAHAMTITTTNKDQTNKPIN